MAEPTPSRIWCKICGITSVEDGVQAAQAGADALGFNFYPPSRRYLNPTQATRIVPGVKSAAPQAARFGLFVDADVETVASVIASVELDVLQFHGNESAAFCAQFGLPYMKVLRVGSGFSGEQLQRTAQTYTDADTPAWALMLDTYVKGQPGGTGSVFDWSLWPGNLHPRMVLAGGLNADNVGAAITAVHPFGVDVSSGVENAGAECAQKDPQLVRRFIKEVRSVH